MKKQFFRVKQLVDQTVSRAEKSEVLTEDIQSAEKHIDIVKVSCSNTAKKICGLISASEGVNEEKRAKKIPETVLGYSMIESASPLGDKSILKDLLTDCGSMEVRLGHEQLQYEIEVEKLVLQPLNQVEIEANNISKARRNLNKLILDMDSARTRYQTAQRQANSGGNATKIDGIKEELEEAQVKVDQSRDSLAADIYTFLAKESELAKLILQFAECQRKYHQAALELLDKNIPELEEQWKRHEQKPVFGCDFEEHLMVTRRTVALPIEICVCVLSETGMDEEGLFRIAGGASKVRKFRAALDSGHADLAFAFDLHDVHIIAGTLKSYLRELPDPLLSHALYDDFVNTMRINDPEARRNALRDVIQRLPESRLTNIRYLMKFFHELSKHQEHNKMTPQNLAIVLAPSFLWPPENGGDVFGLSALANTHALIVEHLISNADWLFPGEIDYFVTFPRTSPLTPSPNGHLNSGSICPPVNGDRLDDQQSKEEEERGHRRIGSLEGVVELRNTPSGHIPESGAKIESPRPTSRKKNKPAPVPPGHGTSAGGTPSSRSPMSMKTTPDKDERKTPSNDGVASVIPERPSAVEKPSLPPTGPDSRRLSSFEKRPTLAPRPSVNPLSEPRTASHQPHLPGPIGFESIESELRSRVAKREQATQPTNLKSDDEISNEQKKLTNPVAKRMSASDGGQQTSPSPNPTHHPNAVPVFGFHPPVPGEKTKSDSTDGKPRPNIPDRPTSVRINQGASPVSTSQDQSPSDGRGPHSAVLERIQSYSVNKQQVSIVQVNASNPPLSLNSSDHPDIQFADSEDIPPTNASQSQPPHVQSIPVESDNHECAAADASVTTVSTVPVSISGQSASESAPKPERPPKPERLSHASNCIESNNNKSESEEESAIVCSNVPVPSTSSSIGTLPRPCPVPRPQPPAPPTKPRPSVNIGSSGNVTPESTDF